MSSLRRVKEPKATMNKNPLGKRPCLSSPTCHCEMSSYQTDVQNRCGTLGKMFSISCLEMTHLASQMEARNLFLPETEAKCRRDNLAITVVQNQRPRYVWRMRAILPWSSAAVDVEEIVQLTAKLCARPTPSM